MKAKFATKKFMAETLFGTDEYGHEFSNLGNECAAKNFGEFAAEVKNMVDTFNFVTEDGALHLDRSDMQTHLSCVGECKYFYTQMPSFAAMRRRWKQIQEWRKF